MADREPSNHVYPIYITVPTDILSSDLAHIPLSNATQSGRLFAIDGYLRSLTSGTFTVTLRDMMDDTLFATVTWATAGDVMGVGPGRDGSVDYSFRGIGSGIKLASTSLGVGALNCNLTLWMRLAI